VSVEPAVRRRRGFAIASLVLGILSLPTIGLVGIGAVLGIVFGVVALVKASRAPAEFGGQGMAIAGIVLSVVSVLVMPFMIGIIAAIAIPSLLRARVSANEAAAIGDIRAVISAEAAYSAVNGGYYDTLECLAAPVRCIPGYSGPALVDAELAAPSVRHGYSRVFHPGPAPASALPPTVSRSSLTSFALVAVPVQRGQTGVRAFCGEASGRIRYKADGSAPDVVAGSCPEDWPDLR
jgi:type II secretory pathway pseudopilin PulG